MNDDLSVLFLFVTLIKFHLGPVRPSNCLFAKEEMIRLHFFPDENGVTIMSKKFTVKDTNGKVVFATEADETDIASRRINIQSNFDGGGGSQT